MLLPHSSIHLPPIFLLLLCIAFLCALGPQTIICILFTLNHLRVKGRYITSLSLMIAYTITFSDALSVNSNDCPLSLTFNLNNTVYIYYNVGLIATYPVYLVMLSFCFHILIVQSGGFIVTSHSTILSALTTTVPQILIPSLPQ